MLSISLAPGSRRNKDGCAMGAELSEIVARLDRELDHAGIGDYPGAVNGLQLENSGTVTSLACAVDANRLTIAKAVALQARLLIVHHGIGWNSLCPVTGGRYRWLKMAIENDLAIYSSHLPLDAHEAFGNSVLLARALEFPDSTPYGEEKGTCIGRAVDTDVIRVVVVDRVTRSLGSAPMVIGAGPERISRMAIISGGSGNMIHRVAADGFDTLLAGEASHWTYSAAHEYGINLILAGHYLTETLGVRALAEFVGREYRLPWTFIDEPSGL